MRKAISEILVIVLFLTLVAVLFSSAYLFMSGFKDQSVSEAAQKNSEALKRAGSCLEAVSFDDKTNELLLKNCGKYELSNFTVFVDGAPTIFDSSSIKPNEVKSFEVSSGKGAHTIKVSGDYAEAITAAEVKTSVFSKVWESDSDWDSGTFSKTLSSGGFLQLDKASGSWAQTSTADFLPDKLENTTAAADSVSLSAETHISSAEFGSTQGFKNWRYYKENSFGESQLGWTGAYWSSSCGSRQCMIYSDRIYQGSDSATKRRWISPDNMIVRIKGTFVMQPVGTCRDYDRVQVQIKINNIPISSQIMKCSSGNIYDYDLSSSVGAGDKIDFVVEKKLPSNNYYYYFSDNAVISFFNKTGAVSTPEIKPTAHFSWDKMTHSKNEMPGASVAVDVLKASDSSVLCANPASGSSIAACAGSNPIKLKAYFSTANTQQTPALLDWAVNYISPDYASSGYYVSQPIATAESVMSVTPSFSKTETSGATLSVDISSDGGATWITNAASGAAYTSGGGIGVGKRLIFRANFATSDAAQTAKLDRIALKYTS